MSEGKGEDVTDLLKSVYAKKRESIEYMLKFGSPSERAKASLIRDIANGYRIQH